MLAEDEVQYRVSLDRAFMCSGTSGFCMPNEP